MAVKATNPTILELAVKLRAAGIMAQDPGDCGTYRVRWSKRTASRSLVKMIMNETKWQDSWGRKGQF